MVEHGDSIAPGVSRRSSTGMLAANRSWRISMPDEPTPDAAEPERKKNIVVGKAQGEWGDTLPGATLDADEMPSADDETRTDATHPPIVGMEEMPPAQDASKHEAG
jgi:hypothetical protein